MTPSGGPDVIGVAALVDDIEWNILGQIYRPKQVAGRCLFWVTPTGRLYDLFVAIDALGEHRMPDAVVALAAAHEVEFLPPPPS